MKGFIFPYGNKDVFVVTNRKNKTDALGKEIIREMVNLGIDLPDNPDVRKEILYYLCRAECEIIIPNKGNPYYEIHGENFGGRGSFVGDGKTILVYLEERR